MNLGVSIANLLRRYPAVGVPGIGVFRRIHSPASYDADSSAFLPPADRIELVESDADVFPLTSYLEAQQQLDGYAAEAMLHDAVKVVMDTISQKGETVLDGLGYLVADGASILFKPFETDGFTAKPIDVAPLAIDISDEPAPSSDEVVVEPELEPEPDSVTVEEAGRVSYTPWVISGAVAAVLIAIAVVWQYQPDWFGSRAMEPTKEERESIPPIAVDAAEDSLVADTVVATAAADQASVDSVPAAGVPPTTPSVTYEIIVGSFTSMRQADKFVAEMKAKGYDLQAIDSRMPGNRKKISWGSYATEEEAYKELARVQKTFEPGAWIAKITHN